MREKQLWGVLRFSELADEETSPHLCLLLVQRQVNQDTQPRAPSLALTSSKALGLAFRMFMWSYIFVKFL